MKNMWLRHIGVKKHRAKHCARATEPTPPTSTLDNDNRQETKP